MEIRRLESGATILAFPQCELKVALSILKAIYTVSKLAFVKECIDDLEIELRPRLTLVSHNHLCESCFRMVDDQGENAIHLTGSVDKWKHKNCLPLKQNRP